MVIGGAGIGLVLGWLFVQIHKLLDTEPASDVALTLIEPYFMYLAAELLHSSGVLAVVAGGLYMSSKRLIFLTVPAESKVTAFGKVLFSFSTASCFC
jgi:CPA1 family monovalent cation:H+ antiporter